MTGYHRPYPQEFRREAVELARSSGKSVPDVAKDLGISDQALRTWLRQTDIDEGRRGGVTSSEREQLQQENARLRRENRVLREEREILKKVVMTPGGASPGRMKSLRGTGRDRRRRRLVL